MATELYTGLTADCTGLEIDPETRLLRQTRPAFGGNIMATIICPNHRPQMATVRHRVFEMPTPDPGAPGPDRAGARRAGGGADRHQGASISSREEGEVNLADAKIIVSGGRGVGGPEGFAPLRELAEVLGGARGRLARGGGRRLDPLCASGGPDRPHRAPRPVHRLRHLGRHPAPAPACRPRG